MTLLKEKDGIKIGLAIAPQDALPTVFTVFRESLATGMAKAAKLGFDGVELALYHRDQADCRS